MLRARLLVPVLLASCVVPVLGSVAACSDTDGGPTTGDVIIIGDSMLAWNRDVGGSIGHVIGSETGLAVADRAISGTHLLKGDDSIPKQFVANAKGTWKWLVVDGGGNDLNDTCSCGECSAVLDKLVTADGAGGGFAELFDGQAGKFTKAIVLGYPEPRPDSQGFKGCGDELAVLRTRWKKLADLRDNVWFVNGGDVMTPDKVELYVGDGVHPSVAGSAALGKLVAATINANP